MKQFPSRLKYKKNHKPKKSWLYLKEQKNFFPYYGLYSIKALESGLLVYSQIEACRKSIRRTLKKKGKLSLRIFTGISWTKKGLASRMGKGKGNHHHWVSMVRAGQVICEVGGVPEILAKRALEAGSKKLPMQTFVLKNLY